LRQAGVEIARDGNAREFRLHEPLDAHEHLVDVDAPIRRRAMRSEQAVDERTQPIGLGDDHLRVFGERRPRELAFEQLRGAANAAERILDLVREIKNPLGGIRGAAQLLEGELARPALAEYTQVIIAEADRLRALVDRLLGPHRAPAYRRVNVHEVLVRVKGVVQAEFPSIPIVCDFDSSLPDIDADHEQLMQAALNIVRNAAQALSGSPVATPSIRLVTRVARGVTLARRQHRLAIAI